MRPKTIVYDEGIHKENNVSYTKISQLHESISDVDHYDVINIDHWKVVWERVPRFLVKRQWHDKKMIGEEYSYSEFFATKSDPIGSIVAYFDTVNPGLDRIELGGDLVNCYSYLVIQTVLTLAPDRELKYAILEDKRTFIAELLGERRRLVYILVSAGFIDIFHLYDTKNRNEPPPV